MPDKTNIIHPTAILGKNVKLGSGNYIGPYCVIRGDVEIGDNNRFISHVSVGSPPEHRRFPIDPSTLDSIGRITIGSNNTFFEFVTVNHPVQRVTAIGSECFFLAHVYLPHDCIIEDGVTIANGCTIGGYSILMRGCNLGFSVSVHQHTTIGPYCMVGMGSVVLKDLPPYCVYVGVGPRRLGVNNVGLSRNGFEESTIRVIQEWVDSGLDALPNLEIVRADMARYQEYSGRRAV